MEYDPTRFGPVADEYLPMATLLQKAIQEVDKADTLRIPSTHPGYQAAESSSHTFDIAASSTNPDAESSKFKDWDWACQKGENSWCTVNPKRSLWYTVTVLVHSNRQSDISIFLALPEPCEEATRYWGEGANLSQVTGAVRKIMDTVKLSACLMKWKDRAQNSKKIELDAEVDEFLMKTANSLMGKFKLSRLSVTGNGLPCDVIPYDVVFRQAKNWDDITPRRRYSDPKTLIEDPPSTKTYSLTSNQADRYLAFVKSLGDRKAGK